MQTEIEIENIKEAATKLREDIEKKLGTTASEFITQMKDKITGLEEIVNTLNTTDTKNITSEDLKDINNQITDAQNLLNVITIKPTNELLTKDGIVEKGTRIKTNLQNALKDLPEGEKKEALALDIDNLSFFISAVRNLDLDEDNKEEYEILLTQFNNNISSYDPSINAIHAGDVEENKEVYTSFTNENNQKRDNDTTVSKSKTNQEALDNYDDEDKNVTNKNKRKFEESDKNNKETNSQQLDNNTVNNQLTPLSTGKIIRRRVLIGLGFLLGAAFIGFVSMFIPVVGPFLIGAAILAAKAVGIAGLTATATATTPWIVGGVATAILAVPIVVGTIVAARSDFKKAKKAERSKQSFDTEVDPEFGNSTHPQGEPNKENVNKVKLTFGQNKKVKLTFGQSTATILQNTPPPQGKPNKENVNDDQNKNEEIVENTNPTTDGDDTNKILELIVIEENKGTTNSDNDEKNRDPGQQNTF